MATTSLEAIRRIEIEAKSKGLDEVAAKLDKVAQSQEGVVASSTNVTKSAGSVAEAFKRTERQLDSNVVAYDKFARSAKAVNDALAQGLTGPERAAELISMAEGRLRKATGSMNEFGKATAQAGAAAGPARHEWINLSRQLQDVGVMAAGGQSVFSIITTQLPQITDVIVSSRSSLGEFVSGALTGAGRFLAAWGPVAAAVAAVGAAAYAAMHATDEARQARIATTSGRGRLSGISADQVPLLAERGRTAGVSAGDAREGVLEFVRAGASATSTLEGMAIATRVAATTGTDLAAAYKLLAGVIRDPAAAAKQLDDQYRILDKDQQDNIATMQANGDRAGAASLVIKGLTGAIVSAKDATTSWSNAWSDLTTSVDKAFKAMSKGPSAMEQLLAMQQVLKDQEQTNAAVPVPAPFRDSFQRGFAPTAPTARIDSTIGREGLANAIEMQAQAEAMSRADKEINANLAEQKRLRADVTGEIEKMNTAFANEVAVMNATTVEQKALATQQQVMNDLIDKNVNAVQAAAQAELAANRIREQAAATSRQRVADQQIEIEINSRMIGAYQNQTGALDSVIARLKEEQSIRQAGLDVTTAENQKRIENAGRIAEQTKALEALKSAQQGSMATTYNPNAAGGYEMASGSGISDRTSRYNDKLQSIQDQMARSADYAMRAMDGWRDAVNNAADGTYSLDKAARSAAGSVATLGDAASTSFAAGGDKPMSQRGGFTSTIISSDYWREALMKSREEQDKVGEQIRDAGRAAQQKQLGFASQTIQDQIQALQDQKSALQENTSAIEEATTKRREQLDKEIAKLEKALNPSRPDPYAERNPDYFYRFGTQAFKENDPMQELLSAAEAERDALDAQLDTQKKSVELQQTAIDAQIRGYEAQVKELQRASNLLSNGVDLSAQEVAGIKGIIAAIAGLGDYSRLQAANATQTATAMSNIQTAAPGQNNAALGLSAGTPTYKYGYQTGYSGFFAAGGYIPPGSWGIAGEAGPEVITRKRAIAGPAQVTPIRAGGDRPIVVNQTIVSQGGMRELRASRGELAQRSSSEVRRSLGAR